MPGKNIREVGGRPLIAWTIEEAKRSRYIDRLVLSSDDLEIIEVARAWGCEVPFIRPAQLARDETPGIEPVLHALAELPGYEIVVLLQATSPLRSAADLDGCIEHCVTKCAKACVSVTQTEQSPYWMYTLQPGGAMVPVMPSGVQVTRRQNLPPTYALNGAVYVADSAWLRERRSFLAEETLGYVMPRERSLDIDTELDFRVLESLSHPTPAETR